MRVLYITEGLTVHDLRFLRALQQDRMEIGFVRLNHAEPRTPLPAGIREFVPRRSGQRFRVRDAVMLRGWLQDTLEAFRPDVVHAGPMHAGALLAATAGAHPLISMSWGSDLLKGAEGPWANLRARFTLRRSRLLLCDCQSVRGRALQLGMSESRIVVFPWGVDLRHFRPAGRRRAQRSKQGAVLVSARSLEPIYGPDVLAEGFYRAWRSVPELRLVVLGDGSARPSMEDRLRPATEAGAVRWVGVVDEPRLATYFRQADLYVSSSRSDGSSVSLLQAMACGLPVVASNIPGNREWVAQGSGGWLFDDGDPESLAEHDPVRLGSASSVAGNGKGQPQNC